MWRRSPSFGGVWGHVADVRVWHLGWSFAVSHPGGVDASVCQPTGPRRSIDQRHAAKQRILVPRNAILRSTSRSIREHRLLEHSPSLCAALQAFSGESNSGLASEGTLMGRSHTHYLYRGEFSRAVRAELQDSPSESPPTTAITPGTAQRRRRME